MYTIIKRFFDIVFSMLGILFTWPFMLLAIIGILLSGESKPVFVQLRVGKDRQLFRFYKLRTMKRTISANTGPITLHGDDRITKLGLFLRWSKIDEFPQFFNVLNGELSFVGPRALMPETFYKYDKATQKKISKVTPGITGVGSVVFRNEAVLLKNAGNKQEEFYLNTILPYKGELEVWYAKNRSFWVDFKLLFFSVLVVLYSRLTGLHRYFKQMPVNSAIIMQVEQR